MVHRALLAAIVLSFAFVLPAAVRAGSRGGPITAVNASRAAAGLPALARSSVLEGLAARHNVAMAARGAVYHNSALTSQLRATGVSWVVAGENVGVGRSTRAIHDAFMRSASHRQNVLSSEYNAVGIDVATSGGRVYVTQVFAALGSSRSRAGAPAGADVVAPDPGCPMHTAEDGSRVPASFYGLPC